jgi:hypothetical protein
VGKAAIKAIWRERLAVIRGVILKPNLLLWVKKHTRERE